MRLFQKGMTLLELSVVLLVLIALAGMVMPYVSGTGRMAMCQATDATLQAVKEAIMGGAAGPGFYGDTLGYYPKDTKSTTTDHNLLYLYSAPSGWGAYNPKTAVGWRGPYLMHGMTNEYAVDADSDADLTDELHSSFGDTTNILDVAVAVNDQVILDGWGRPIILQVPTANCTPYPSNPGKCARIVSAGAIPGRYIQSNGFTATLTDGDAATRDDDRVLFLQIPDPNPGGNIPCNEL